MENKTNVEEVALYVRVSTDEQAINGDSLRTQRDELTKYALENGFHVFGIYEDDGFSATNNRMVPSLTYIWRPSP